METDHVKNLSLGFIHLLRGTRRDKSSSSPRLLSLATCGRSRKLRGLLPDVSHAPDHVEGILGDVVAIAREHLFEVSKCCVEVHEGTGRAREDLCDEEGLGEEADHLACVCNGNFVLLAELIHPQDRD